MPENNLLVPFVPAGVMRLDDHDGRFSLLALIIILMAVMKAVPQRASSPAIIKPKTFFSGDSLVNCCSTQRQPLW